METKIERKVADLVKSFFDEGKFYKCSYESNGEDGNFIKKLEILENDGDYPKTLGYIEFHSLRYDNNNNYVTKFYFTLVTDKIDITFYEETSQKLWNLLTKLINKKWNADDLLVA